MKRNNMVLCRKSYGGDLVGAKWEKWKEEFAEEKKKQQEKDRIKAERKAEQRANMTTTDKVAKEAWGTAKTYMFVRYLPHMLISLMVIFLIGWYLLDSAWNWFIGLF